MYCNTAHFVSSVRGEVVGLQKTDCPTKPASRIASAIRHNPKSRRKNMKATTNTASVVTLLAGMFLLTVVPGAHAKSKVCSNATLSGQYSAVLTGTVNGLPFAALDIVVSGWQREHFRQWDDRCQRHRHADKLYGGVHRERRLHRFVRFQRNDGKPYYFPGRPRRSIYSDWNALGSSYRDWSGKDLKLKSNAECLNNLCWSSIPLIQLSSRARAPASASANRSTIRREGSGDSER